MRSQRRDPLQSRVDPISIVIMLLVSLLVLTAIVYFERHFVDAQHHGMIVPKPATKK